jgi:hypothetical protein
MAEWLADQFAKPWLEQGVRGNWERACRQPMSEPEGVSRSVAFAEVLLDMARDCGVTTPILMTACSMLLAAGLVYDERAVVRVNPSGGLVTLDEQIERHVVALKDLIALMRKRMTPAPTAAGAVRGDALMGPVLA